MSREHGETVCVFYGKGIYRMNAFWRLDTGSAMTTADTHDRYAPFAGKWLGGRERPDASVEYEYDGRIAMWTDVYRIWCGSS